MKRLLGVFYLPIEGDKEDAKTRVEMLLGALKARLQSMTEEDDKFVVIFIAQLPETPTTLFNWVLHGMIQRYALEIVE